MVELATGLFFPNMTDIFLFSLSLVVAEFYNQLKIRAVFSIQRDVDKARKNLIFLAERLKEQHSQSVVYIGKKMFNFHHWRLGLLLVALSTWFVNMHMFFISLGLIVHHLLRRKSYSKSSS